MAKAARRFKEQVGAQKAAGLLAGQEEPEFKKTELKDAEKELMLSAREPQVSSARGAPPPPLDTTPHNHPERPSSLNNYAAGGG